MCRILNQVRFTFRRKKMGNAYSKLFILMERRGYPLATTLCIKKGGMAIMVKLQPGGRRVLKRPKKGG